MSEAIVLDTPEQINAWIWLSRLHQCELHMKGYTHPGLFTWLRRNVPDLTTERTVKAAYPRLLDHMDTLGVLPAEHEEKCNYQILLTPSALDGLYFDFGVVGSLSDIEANADFVAAYGEGRLVIIRTAENVRDRNPKIQMTREG